MSTRKFILLIILVILAGFLWAVLKTQEQMQKPALVENQQTAFTDPEYSIQFSYPTSWGVVSVEEGNDICPDEDTYRTGDTLVRYNREYAFPDIDLENTESFIRSGIRVYKIMDGSEACQDELVRAIISGINPQSVSSVKLDPATAEGFGFGMYNNSAGRLDTEYRSQYTFFKEIDGGVLAVQPYFNFIPYADSPEWIEIDTKYQRNSAGYVDEGTTAGEIRKYKDEFNVIVQSLAYKPH
jgi:hypothetical protein